MTEEIKEITLLRTGRKNNRKRRGGLFLRGLFVWANFTTMAGKKRVHVARDSEWWLPLTVKRKKRWFQDQSKLAREWAEREYELDYHDVEFKKI